MYEIHRVYIEKSVVAKIYLLERRGQERHKCVAVTVFEDDQHAVIRGIGVNFENGVISADEYGVARCNIVVLKEKLSLIALAEIGIVENDPQLIEVCGLVVGESVGVFLQRVYVVHRVERPQIALALNFFIAFKIGKINARLFSIHLSRVVSRKGLPVVIGAGVDVLRLVFFQYRIYRHALARSHHGVHFISAFFLVGIAVFQFGRRVECL